MSSFEFWSVVKSNLKAKNSNNKLLQTWFDPTTLIDVETLNGGGKRFKLGVPSKLHKYWIVENLFDGICSEISSLYEDKFELELIVTGQPIPVEPDSSDALREAINIQDNTGFTNTSFPKTQTQPSPSHYLNPHYTFSSFVVGKNTEFAHAASYNVAQNPGADGYNPLFICGPVGMGKTHLLNSVGNQILENQPHLRVSYVSAEKFLNECISGIRRNEMDKFRLKYRERCNILLVDDVQFLGRGEAVQEEFFHTLDDLLQKGSQVVVASDRMPKDIQGLEDRIRSRLEWGLIADIQMPDLETRIAILRYKAEKLNLKIPDDAIGYVARISKRSVRELEGNLKKLKMFSELQGLSVNLELVRKVLSTHDDPTAITTEDIQKIVNAHYNIKMSDLKGKNRAKEIVTARQVAMYLVKKHLDKSLMDIGRSFGNRDHTTVINAVKRIESKLQNNLDLKRDLNDLTGRIHKITGV